MQIRFVFFGYAHPLYRHPFPIIRFSIDRRAENTAMFAWSRGPLIGGTETGFEPEIRCSFR